MSCSFLRYPGGKSKKCIQNYILQFAPQTIQEYREPFVGGGGIFFAFDGKNRAIPPLRWINDKNEDLISVYLALKNNPDEFIEKCRAIQPAQEGELETGPRESSTGKKYNARLKKFFDFCVENRKNDPALSYFFINRTVWGGRVNYDIESRLYFSNPGGWNIVTTKRLEQAAKLLKGVQISCDDYSSLFEADGKDVWIYADPPYIKDTTLSAPSKLYQNSFLKDDHVRLAECIKKTKHRVCLSYDDDPDGLVRDLYGDKRFKIHECEWRYCGRSSATKGEKVAKVVGKELVITNYETNVPVSCSLVDSTEVQAKTVNRLFSLFAFECSSVRRTLGS